MCPLLRFSARAILTRLVFLHHMLPVSPSTVMALFYPPVPSSSPPASTWHETYARGGCFLIDNDTPQRGTSRSYKTSKHDDSRRIYGTRCPRLSCLDKHLWRALSITGWRPTVEAWGWAGDIGPWPSITPVCPSPETIACQIAIQTTENRPDLLAGSITADMWRGTAARVLILSVVFVVDGQQKMVDFRLDTPYVSVKKTADSLGPSNLLPDTAMDLSGH